MIGLEGWTLEFTLNSEGLRQSDFISLRRLYFREEKILSFKSIKSQGRSISQAQNLGASCWGELQPSAAFGGPQQLPFSEKAHREQAFADGSPSSQRLGSQEGMPGECQAPPPPSHPAGTELSDQMSLRTGSSEYAPKRKTRKENLKVSSCGGQR